MAFVLIILSLLSVLTKLTRQIAGKKITIETLIVKQSSNS